MWAVQPPGEADCDNSAAFAQRRSLCVICIVPSRCPSSSNMASTFPADLQADHRPVYTRSSHHDTCTKIYPRTKETSSRQSAGEMVRA